MDAFVKIGFVFEVRTRWLWEEGEVKGQWV